MPIHVPGIEVKGHHIQLICSEGCWQLLGQMNALGTLWFSYRESKIERSQ